MQEAIDVSLVHQRQSDASRLTKSQVSLTSMNWPDPQVGAQSRSLPDWHAPPQTPVNSAEEAELIAGLDPVLSKAPARITTQTPRTRIRMSISFFWVKRRDPRVAQIHGQDTLRLPHSCNKRLCASTDRTRGALNRPSPGKGPRQSRSCADGTRPCGHTPDDDAEPPPSSLRPTQNRHQLRCGTETQGRASHSEPSLPLPPLLQDSTFDSILTCARALNPLHLARMMAHLTVATAILFSCLILAWPHATRTPPPIADGIPPPPVALEQHAFGQHNSGIAREQVETRLLASCTLEISARWSNGDAAVGLVLTVSENTEDCAISKPWTVQCDRKGEAILKDLPPGQVAISAMSHAPLLATLTAGSRIHVSYITPQAETIYGRVIEGVSVHSRGSRIQMLSHGGSPDASTGDWLQVAEAGSDGSFTIRDIDIPCTLRATTATGASSRPIEVQGSYGPLIFNLP